MPDPFDPYYRWLGIPPKDQPPDHYRLLAIQPFEDNPDVIESAADQRMVHLRNYQTGEHGELSQKLLNEVAAASVCLLNPPKKMAYDAGLRQRLAAEAAARQMSSLRPEPVPVIRTSPRAASAAVAKRGPIKPAAVAAAGVVLGLVVLLMVWGLRSKEGLPEQAGAPSTVPAPATGSPSAAEDKPPGEATPAAQVERPAAEPEAAVEPDETPPHQPEPTAEPEPEPTAEPEPESEPEPKGPGPAEPSPPEPAGADPKGPAKPAVPSDLAQQAAAELAREVYAEEYEKAKTDADKRALGRKFLGKALEAQDLASCYVLLRLARDTAAGGGDLVAAFQAIAEMDRRFQIDALRMNTSVLSGFADKARLPVEHGFLAERSVELIDRALVRDDFDLAGDLAEMALSEARKARDNALVQLCKDHLAQIEQTAGRHEQVKAAAQQLASNRAEPEANLQVGRYRCFVKGDWQNGLPMLALGGDPTLKALAVKELEDVSEPAEQVELAEAWSALAESAEDGANGHLLGRAYHWYDQAVPHLAGLEKDRVKKKLKELRATGSLTLRVPKDVQEFLGHYYKLLPTPMTRHLAQEECERLGGYLVRIEFAEEQDFVFRLAGGSASLHVDGSDEVHEGVWVFRNGTPMKYVNWGRGSPDNHNGSEHAIELSRRGPWNDNSAAVRRPFVCEWDRIYSRVLPRPEVTRKIPRGTVRFQGHRYLRVDTPTTWHVAKRICEATGGHLAQVESYEESEFLKKLIARGRQKAPWAHWLDGADEAIEGDWRLSDGKTMSYTNWRPGEPDNAHGGQHSLCIGKAGQWWDAADGSRLGFLCEWDD